VLEETVTSNSNLKSKRKEDRNREPVGKSKRKEDRNRKSCRNSKR
jgi:hypothetical protein